MRWRGLPAFALREVITWAFPCFEGCCCDRFASGDLSFFEDDGIPGILFPVCNQEGVSQGGLVEQEAVGGKPETVIGEAGWWIGLQGAPGSNCHRSQAQPEG